MRPCLERRTCHPSSRKAPNHGAFSFASRLSHPFNQRNTWNLRQFNAATVYRLSLGISNQQWPPERSPSSGARVGSSHDGYGSRRSPNGVTRQRRIPLLALGVAATVMIANYPYGWTFFVSGIQNTFGWDRASIQWAFTLMVLNTAEINPA
jgi:hypothetical protein